MEGGWDALVSGAARAIAEHTVRLDALTRAVAGEHSPTARLNLARLTDALAGAGLHDGRATVTKRSTR